MLATFGDIDVEVGGRCPLCAQSRWQREVRLKGVTL